MRRPPTHAQMMKAVGTFNERIAPGETVLVIDDFGEISEDKTKGPAQILSGHTPVVWLEKKGMYLLDRVKKKVGA